MNGRQGASWPLALVTLGPETEIAQCATEEEPKLPQTFADMVHNSTAWDYPVELHARICCELKINPRTFIVPQLVRVLWAVHVPGFEDMVETEAFSDECGNVVYFYDPKWSEQYSLWIVHHELFHQTQFYDKGNAMGGRWDDMGTKQMVDAWEKEACRYADKKVGKVGKDFGPYKDVAFTPATQGDTAETPQIAPRLKLGRPRGLTARKRFTI